MQRQSHFLPAARHCSLMHCEQAFAYHMSSAGMPGLDFATAGKKDSESGCASRDAVYFP